MGGKYFPVYIIYIFELNKLWQLQFKHKTTQHWSSLKLIELVFKHLLLTYVQLSTYIFKPVLGQLGQKGEEAKNGEPGDPRYNLLQRLNIHHSENEYKFVEQEVPKLVPQMLEEKKERKEGWMVEDNTCICILTFFILKHWL